MPSSTGILLRRCKASTSTELKKMVTSSLAQFRQNPENEPVLNYSPGSQERMAVDESVKKYYGSVTEIPIMIGDEEISTKIEQHQVMPSEHSHVLTRFYHADEQVLSKAVNSCLRAREKWERRPMIERAEILYKAADLVATKYRADLNATTMLGQAKTYVQAEIDSSCELADFFRFNARFALRLIEDYKPISPEGVTNEMTLRGLEGFVAAISPFNFTAIGGNLSSAPALMGNVVLWKPSDTSVLSNFLIYKILREAGLPAGVINFVPSHGPIFGNFITRHQDLAAINFTGSVPTFRHLWRQVGQNIDSFKGFPKLIGECGGKNFHFVHPSADMDTVIPCSARAAFEFQGQKCSALARLYMPRSLWSTGKQKLIDLMGEMVVGQPNDTGAFMSAVIDRKAFDRIRSYIEYAKNSPNLTLLAGGQCDDSKGYFVQPTLIECRDVGDKIFKEEIFGPVLAVHVYEDADCEKLLKSVQYHTPYALTGAVFAQDEKFLANARDVLRESCGNFYLNDKCTGSVVGQQPFGGAMLSGTNDKAGGPHYLLRFASPWTIKRAHGPLHQWRYPSMD